MNEHLQRLSEGATLTQEEAESAMNLMMSGEAEPVQVAALLMGLRSRGETLDELTGFTRIMRKYAVHVECGDPHAVDLCGTGGDRSGTFNISTAAAFVCAGAGVTVVKHGNRSVSSKAGSADVLEALGVNVNLGKEGVEHCLQETGICFLFAPYFHPAMRFVMPVRRTLGVRTFFNILGPLCNPAGTTRQLVGAFNITVAKTMVQILARLGAQRVVSVHADDGLDEITVTADSQLYVLKNQHTTPESISLSPEHHGFQRSTAAELQGGTAEENAEIILNVFDGRPGAPRDVVLLNAAYAMYTSGRYTDIEHALDAAKESIDAGKAKAAVTALAEASQQAPGI